MHSFLVSTFNFSLLVILLAYKLRKPTKAFVTERHDSIRNEIQTVREQLNHAERKFAEFTSKLQLIDAELRSLREQCSQDILKTKQRMMTEVTQLTKTIISDANAASSTLFSELKNELYTELSLQAIDRAEQILKDRLTGEDRTRIRQAFSKQFEGVQ